jgi:hypothetical protein
VAAVRDRGCDAHADAAGDAVSVPDAVSDALAPTLSVAVGVRLAVAACEADDDALAVMDGELPSASDEDVLVCASLAVTVGQVCAVLYQIPNADIVFAADPLQQSRSEDAAVAFTWYNFMINHPDEPHWALYFPMAKAGINGNK